MVFTLNRLIRRIRRRRELGAGILLLVLVVCIAGNALTFFYFDRTVNGGISIGDAFWYSFISIATIGYGDFSAATLGARLGTLFFIVFVGLATFTSAVGIGVDWVVEHQYKERSGMSNVLSRNHLLIVNFPNERRVRQIIDEYLQDMRHKNDEIIILTDRLESLPFAQNNVAFVRGSPLEEEPYMRANVGQARQAIVLSTNYDDPNSDSVVASIAFILGHMNPNIRIIAECLDTRHALLFQDSRNVSLVFTLDIASSLIVQEVQDPGVNMLIQAITSNLIEGDLESAMVMGGTGQALPYKEVAQKLLDYDINLVGHVRDRNVYVNFGNLLLTENDRLVYISMRKYDWPALRALLV